MKLLFQKIQYFMKADTVLFISAVAAILTMFFVPPSTEYINYLNLRVLSLLFCLMAVVAGFQKTGVFLLLSERLLKRVKTIRSLSFVLIMLCFFSSMLITNDVALITFVPFAIIVLSMTGQSKYIIKVVVLQTIAANLGSMLTPIGNPQNLYLYTTFNIGMKEFVHITFPYTVVSFVLLCITVFIIKKEPLNSNLPYMTNWQTPSLARGHKTSNKVKSSKIILYGILFLISIACVLRLLDYRIAFAIVLLTILFLDVQVLKRIDYSLLLTFVCFFIFVGNIGNIAIVKDFLADLLAKRELLVSIAASQIISNVPSAVLLSAFTDHYKTLILGTNIGGLGTLVASLASLISFKLYCKTEEAQSSKYLRTFTIYNVLFLAGLCLFYRFGHYVMWIFLFLLIF